MAFYARWFGFYRELARYPDGTVFVTNGDGFELALHAGSSVADPGWHFGFTFSTPKQVRDLAAQLAAAGIELLDRHDTEEYVGFKCRDPTATGSRPTTNHAREGTVRSGRSP